MNPIVILGMHRSGTSLVSNWLADSGLYLGNRLLQEDASNEKGHFEDLDFLELHKSFLKNRGLPEDGIVSETISKLGDSEINALSTILKEKGNPNTPWGWKDPRTCLFLQDYGKLLKDPFYLVIYRSPSEVAESLINRLKTRNYYRYRRPLKWLVDFQLNAKSNALRLHFEKSWALYNSNILSFIEGLNNRQFCLWSLERLKQNPEVFAKELSVKTNGTITLIPFEQVYSSRLLKNSNSKKITDPWAMETFKRLKELEVGL